MPYISMAAWNTAGYFVTAYATIVAAVAPTADGQALRIGETAVDQVLRTGRHVVHLAATAVFGVEVAKLFAVTVLPR